MTKTSRLFLSSLSIASLIAAASAVAQKPGKIYHESAEVSLVEVPVNVIGHDGLPIRGLKAGDFEIEDEGRPQEVAALDVVDLKKRQPANELGDTLPEAARRHFLFLFDFSFATPNEVVNSRRAAIDFVEKEMGPEDRAAVATTSVETGPKLLVNFTADRKQLAAAIRLLSLPKESEHSRDPLAFAFVLSGDPHFMELVAPGGESYDSSRVALEGELIANIKLYSNLAQKAADEFSESRVTRHLGEMGQLAKALDAVEGTKRVVYFSEGFDGRLLFGSLTKTAPGTTADNDAMSRGSFWALDVDKRYMNSPLELQMSDTMELFRRSDCILYAVDIARLRADGDATMGSPTEGQESLYLFAHETGGEVIQNGNDLVGALRRLNEKTSVTYVLSFHPTVRLGDAKFHRLRVRVRRKGARVSARAGYYEARGFGAMSPLERSLAAADVINGGQPRGDIALNTLAVPLPDSGFSRVPVVVQIPGRQLAGSSGGKLHLGIYVYVTDEQGSLADFFTRSVSLDLSRYEGRLASGDFRFSAACHLLAGRYRLRVYVRDEDSGRYGFTASTLDIPDFAGAKLHALPPLFVSESGSGVNLQDTGAPATPEADNPFEMGGVSFVPRLDPAIASGGDSKICLMVYRVGADPAKPFAIDAEILDAGGRPLGPARVTLIGRSRPGPGGVMKLLLDFSAGNLPPGSYSLKVTVRDPGQSTLASSSEALFTVS